MSFYLILFIPIITATVAQIFLKKGISDLGSLDFSFSNFFALIPRILQNIWLVAGIILFGLSLVVYLFALSKIRLSIAYPIFVSAVLILITLASWFFLKESISWLQISGIIFILFGIFLLATKG